MVVALLSTALTSSIIYAGSAFSNARADFKARLDSDLPSGASAQAIINYDNGQQNWQVQVNVRNLQPNAMYSLEVGMINEWGVDYGAIIATFTTDSNGNANVHNIATGLPESYNVARILAG